MVICIVIATAQALPPSRLMAPRPNLVDHKADSLRIGAILYIDGALTRMGTICFAYVVFKYNL